MQQVNPVRIDGSVLQCSAFMFSRVLSIALLKYKVPAPIATLENLHMASSVIFQKYSVLMRFATFPQVPTHVQQQDSLVFTGRQLFFLTIGLLHFKGFFVFKQFDSRSLPRQISFFLIFSGICWLSWPGLSSEFLGG